jgi:hypothetical protein
MPGGCREGWRWLLHRHCWLPHSHRHDEAITTTAYGANKPLGLAAIPNRLPHCHDVTVQRGIPHELVGPQILQQFLLEDDPVPMRQQVREYLKRLGLQRHGFPGMMELIALGVEAVVAKDVAHHHTFSSILRGALL